MKLTNKKIFPHLDEDTMPIGAWVSPPVGDFHHLGNQDFINTYSYQEIRESGINTIYGLYEDALDYLPRVLEALEYAEENHIGYLVRDRRISRAQTVEEIEKYTQPYRDKSSFAGVLISDEPGVVDYDKLSELQKIYKKVLPHKSFYINLLPLYSENNQLVNGASGGDEWIDNINIDKYYDAYIEKLNPKYISFDYYPLIGEFPSIKDTYFLQLSMIKNKAIINNIPFWVFIQTCSFNEDVRIPIEEEINWQVSTALAYGAKGIQYFTYFLPFDGATEQFKGSMIDENGNKTPIYYYVQKVNQHIKSIDHVLMNARHIGLLVIGKSPIAIPDEDLLKSMRVIKNIAGKHLLIGCFRCCDNIALYIVNNSIDEQDEVSLNFDRCYYVTMIKEDKEEIKHTNYLQLQLFPGEGVLIQLF